MLPSAAEVVARFLRTNGYDETLAAFLTEAGLPPDAGTSQDDKITIEKVLQEKQAYDLTLSFERLGVDDDGSGWSEHAPTTFSAVETLPTRSNILNISLDVVASADADEQRILASTADRRLNALSIVDGTASLHASYQFSDSPILAWTVLRRRYLLCGAMSGKLTLFDLLHARVVEQRQDHTKYIVRIATFTDDDGKCIVATAGWDGKVCIYHIMDSPDIAVGSPSAQLSLESNPASMVLVPHPDDSSPVLIVTRLDSTNLFYYSVPTMSHDDSSTPSVQLQLTALGKQNLAPHSTAWITFTPSCIAISPRDPSLVAVATSQEPHMKLMLVRLLIPPRGPPTATAPESSQASQARAALAIQDREAAAITISCNTMATQTAYSTPLLAWRPDGSGVWVNSDDGVIRGVDARSGKVVAQLKGHAPGSRIRCLWAGKVRDAANGDGYAEGLVSGGFDQKLLVWGQE